MKFEAPPFRKVDATLYLVGIQSRVLLRRMFSLSSGAWWLCEIKKRITESWKFPRHRWEPQYASSLRRRIYQRTRSLHLDIRSGRIRPININLKIKACVCSELVILCIPGACTKLPRYRILLVTVRMGVEVYLILKLRSKTPTSWYVPKSTVFRLFAVTTTMPMFMIDHRYFHSP